MDALGCPKEREINYPTYKRTQDLGLIYILPLPSSYRDEKLKKLRQDK
jgi:hypothetical protein